MVEGLLCLEETYVYIVQTTPPFKYAIPLGCSIFQHFVYLDLSGYANCTFFEKLSRSFFIIKNLRKTLFQINIKQFA